MIVILAEAANADLAEALRACALREAEHNPRESYVKKFLTRNTERESEERVNKSNSVYVMSNWVRALLSGATDAASRQTIATTAP